MPLLATCRCPFRLMRRCFLGKWICLLVSEGFRLLWRCHLFDYSTYIPFCVHWHGGLCLRLLVPNYAAVFRLGWVYLPVSLCHRRLYILPININGYVPFLILLYTLPMNINGYIPFLILLYTLHTNINGYVPFLILLYTLPMKINGYVLFLILLYTLPISINGYFPFLIITLDTIVRGGWYDD